MCEPEVSTGPLSSPKSHVYLTIVPSGSVDPLASKVAVAFWATSTSGPASATGGRLAGSTAVIVRVAVEVTRPSETVWVTS